MNERETLRPSPASRPGPAPSEVPQYAYGWLVYAAAALLTIVLVFVMYRLHYAYGQAPHRIVKMLVGVVVFLLVFFRPTVALHAWLLAIPIGEWLPSTGIPGINGPNLLFIALLVSWIVPRALKRERLARRTRIAAPLAAFIGVLVFSLVRAWIAPPGGAYYPGPDMLKSVWQSSVGVSVYFVVANTVSDAKQVRNLLVTFAVGCAVGALIALRQFVGAEEGRRIGGALGDVNDLGAYFAMCASVLAGLAFASGAFSGVRRLAVWAAAALAFIGVALPKSRGALAGAAVGLGIMTYLTNRRAIVIFLIVLATSPFWAPSFVTERVAETRVAESVEMRVLGDPDDSLDPSAAVRLDIWGIVMAAFVRSPIIGYGYATVPYLTAEKLDKPFSAHSLYVETAGQAGILGLAALFWLIAACVRSGRELLAISPGGLPRGLAIGFLAGTVALFVANLFGQRFTHLSIAGTFFFLAGLVDRSIALRREELSREGAEMELAS